MKKLLSSLMAMSLVATATATVVACGSPKDPEGTLRIGFKENIGNWNPVKTFQASDGRILADTNATPLSVDQYGRIYGDIFKLSNPDFGKEGNSKTHIGDESNDSKTWTYQMRDDVKWVDYKGNVIDTMKPSDFLNAAKFVLNPNNGSEVYQIWASFIFGAEKIRTEAAEEIAKAKKDPSYTPKSFDEIWDKYEKNFGIIPNDQDLTVTFNLTKSVPYFETLLTYTAFSPIHERQLKDPSTNTNFKRGVYSGAFTPTEYKSDQVVVLDKNENYHLKDDTGVNRVRMIYTGGSNSRERELFEATSVHETQLQVADAAGWQKFVGSQPLQEKEDFYESSKPGVSYTEESPESATTYALFFNTFNGELNTSSSPQKIAAGRALQHKEVREFIATNLKRTEFVKYYSSAFDEDGKPSTMLRNTFTPDEVVDGGAYVEKIASAAGTTKEEIADGKAYYESLKTGSEKVQEIIDNDTTIQAGLVDNKLELVLAANPNSKTTTNVKLKDMVNEFHRIKNNPISIKVDESGDYNAYKDKMNGGKFDLGISGWSPDYADANSYLSTLKLGGDYGGYNGSSRLYREIESTTNLDDMTWEKMEQTIIDKAAPKPGENGKPAYKPTVADKNRLALIEGNEAAKTDFTDYLTYSKAVTKTDKDASVPETRKTEFAQQEAKVLYNDFRILPLYKKSTPRTYTASYATPFTKSLVPYGSSSYKHWNMWFNYQDEGNFDLSLLTGSQILALYIKYLEEQKEVKANPTLHQNTSAWDKPKNYN